MGILQVYELQAKRAKEQFNDVVVDVQIFRLASGEPLKLRLEIVDGSIADVYISETGKYSYHWERRLVDGTIYRHDNAPHRNWRNIKTFLKHFHSEAEEVVEESYISDDPLLALEQFLEFARARLGRSL
jgi:hypothetical protein